MSPLRTFAPDLFAGSGVLITGAAKGIGAGLTACFAAHGATVAVQDIDFDGAERLAADLRTRGGDAKALGGDLSESHAANRVFDAAVASLGRIDCLVNNAGRSWAVETDRVDEAEAARLVELNTMSVFWLSRRFVMHRREHQGGGAIVQISSTAGIAGFRKRALYAATKSAVIGLSRVLALDHGAENIRVNCVLPHVVETPMFRSVASPEDAAKWRASIPLGRFATPEDVAGVVLFLCSPAASYLTGGIYVVDGGALAGY